MAAGWRARTVVSASLAAWAASAVVPGRAHAQPRSTAKDRQKAGDLVNKAIEKSQAGDHRAAIDIYLQAFTIVPDPLLLSNIGAEFEQSGKPDEALRYFCMYLEKDPSGTNVPFATAQAKAMQIQLGNKSVDPHDVCAPPKEPVGEPEPAATAKVPKVPKVKTPKPAPEPDPLSEPGALDSDAPSTSGRGGHRNVAGAGSEHGDAGSEHGDGGSERGDGGSEHGDAGIERNGESSDGNPTLRVTGFASAGVGLAATGLGVYAGIKARDISDEINAKPKSQPWTNDIQTLEHRGQSYQNLQIGGLVAGGALIATGVVLYVIGRPSGTEHHDRAITVAPTTNGLVVAGRF